MYKPAWLVQFSSWATTMNHFNSQSPISSLKSLMVHTQETFKLLSKVSEAFTLWSLPVHLSNLTLSALQHLLNQVSLICLDTSTYLCLYTVITFPTLTAPSALSLFTTWSNSIQPLIASSNTISVLFPR